MRVQRYLFPAAAWTTMLACGNSAPSAPPHAPAPRAPIVVTRSIPTLRRVVFRGGLDTLVWSPEPTIAIATSGQVAVIGDFGRAQAMHNRLHIVDANRDSLISTGRSGEGPGELRGGIPFARGDTFDIWDAGRSALLRFANDGKYLGETKLPVWQDRFIIGTSTDSFYAQAMRTTYTGTYLFRLGMHDTLSRALVPANDSLQEVTRALWREHKGHSTLLGYGFAPDRVAVGWDGVSYVIGVYDDAARFLYAVHRDLPLERRTPAELAQEKKSIDFDLADASVPPSLKAMFRARRDTLEREGINRFDAGGIRFDDNGRLWVIGRVGDSTFADVWADSVFLKRTVLPCNRPKRRIAVQGKWLALVCQQPESEAAPFRLQLYEMVEPGKIP